ncbi:MAG TPA: hypothetical protein VHQ65_15290, partial [Thermoanaerobaculia bacterium]|nr:hypothetical protein [Thermoanaerobaculia bacterium]
MPDCRRLAAVLRPCALAVLAFPVLALLGLVPSGSAGAQEGSTTLRVDEAAVEVRDALGAPVADLAPGGLTVREAGEARSVFEVRPETRPWRVVIFLDAGLTATPSLARAARALEASVRELTALGEVEVVLAGERARTVLPPTRDRAALAAALARVSVFERGSDWLVELRREALAGLAEEARAVVAEPGAGGEAGAAPAGDVSAATPGGEIVGSQAPGEPSAPGAALDPALVAALLEAEADLVRERLDLLLGWLGDQPATTPDSGPALLLWITDGFDLQPAAAWAGFAPAWVPGLAVPETGPDLAPAVGTTARAAAALGWTVVPLRVTLEVSEDSRFGVATTEDPTTGDTQVLGRVRVPGR